jgi:hypothetical protein
MADYLGECPGALDALATCIRKAFIEANRNSERGIQTQRMTRERPRASTVSPAIEERCRSSRDVCHYRGFLQGAYLSPYEENS